MFNFDEKPELNITPLVDIMLVLLAILMITTPTMIYEEKINLPNGTKSQSSDQNSKNLVIRVDKEKNIYIDDSKFTQAELKDNLALLSNKYDKDKPVFIKADKELLYDDVMNVLKDVKESGFNKVALQTNG